MRPIKIYHRRAPDWFTPYHEDLDIEAPYNIHVWFASYMWLYVANILFFRNKKSAIFSTIGGTLG